MAKSARFFIEVEARRRVSRPEAGPKAYCYETQRAEFPFGKDQPYATGRAAATAARKFAKALLGQCSMLMLIHWNGSIGQGETIKDEETMFATGWDTVDIPLGGAA